MWVQKYDYSGSKRFIFRSRCRYGRTFRNFFRLVDYLIKTKCLSLETIYAIAGEGRPSFGNGCFPVVYPLHRFLTINGVKPDEKFRMTIDFTRLTHQHELAVAAAAYLFIIIDILKDGVGDIFDIVVYGKYRKYTSLFPKSARLWHLFIVEHVDLDPVDFLSIHPSNVIALGTLLHALYSVKKSKNLLDVISLVCSIGGDCDSTLALALMIGTLYFGKDQYDEMVSFLKQHNNSILQENRSLND